MRSKVLRKRASTYLKSPVEPHKKRFNWSKYIYLSFLGFLILKGIFWIVESQFYISGTGYVTGKPFFIEARRPGRIIAIRCEVNDFVSEGDTLVLLYSEGYYLDASAVGLKRLDRYFLLQRKLIEIQEDITLISKEIDFEEKEYNNLKKEKARADILLAEKALARPNYLLLTAKLEESKNKLSLLRSKLIFAKKKLQKLYYEKSSMPKISSFAPSGFAGINYDRIIITPQNGIVTKIYKSKGEIAELGEPILKVVNNEDLFILGYFDADVENALKMGDEVQVTFEGGEKSTGVVSKIHPTATIPPLELIGKFTATKRLISADIILNEPENSQRIFMTKVNIRIKKNLF